LLFSVVLFAVVLFAVVLLLCCFSLLCCSPLLQELELRIETQKQTLQARDESIKKLLEMLQNKGVGKFMFMFMFCCSLQCSLYSHMGQTCFLASPQNNVCIV
jgi:Na+-transporting NADH:ubiquinone oxidoreductase subunit NqrF